MVDPVPYQEEGHWDACPGRKILWGDIFRDKDPTFLIFFLDSKIILQISTKYKTYVSISHR